jgi:hypothetical protein
MHKQSGPAAAVALALAAPATSSAAARSALGHNNVAASAVSVPSTVTSASARGETTLTRSSAPVRRTRTHLRRPCGCPSRRPRCPRPRTRARSPAWKLRQCPTATILTASPSPAAVGGAVKLTATVTAAGRRHPAGHVQFEVGGIDIGSRIAVSVSGVANTTTTFAAAGTEALSALFTSTAGAYADSRGTFSLVVRPPRRQTAGRAPVLVTIPRSGAFTVTIQPGTVVLTPLSWTATGTLQDVTVADTPNYYRGWSVSGQESDFTGSGASAGRPISGNQLGWTPTVVGSLQDGAILGGTVAPATPGLGYAAATLASAAAGCGHGTNILSANLVLQIPAKTAAGTYVGSLAISYIESQPVPGRCRLCLRRAARDRLCLRRSRGVQRLPAGGLARSEGADRPDLRGAAGEHKLGDRAVRGAAT